ncbi:MAG TPA: FHA domain-containing protein [Pseudonocardia sp.]|nr:FHA domain-containing protein [Pseudonocardia sp.]
MPATGCGRVVVLTHEGTGYRELRPHQSMTFGRAPESDLVFDGDSGLSRRAGSIHHLGPVVAVTNLSTSHSLFVQSDGASRQRLLPTGPAAEPSACFLTAGRHEITSPRWELSGCRIVVSVEAIPLAASDHHADLPSDHARTEVALALKPATKEFATALVLCRPKLLHGPTADVPSVPQLTRAVLAATGCQHLLDRFDDDQASDGDRDDGGDRGDRGGGGKRAGEGERPRRGQASRRTDRDRLVGRIHDHLKQLRAKVFTAGLTTSRELRPHALADVLIENDVLTVAHLDLLTDPEWLTTQERLWWST